MAIEPPAGYITRQDADKKYNRSLKSFERDLAEAQSGSPDFAGVFVLVTNDEKVRPADTVDASLVKQLKTDGRNPVWYVSEEWLESTWGRRGQPIPKKTRRATTRGTTSASTDSALAKADDEGQGSRDSISSLPDDIAFLKQRILTLEQEKAAEIERNRVREEKLFLQFDKKDTQIASLSELSQGLTKGLATGQLKPTEAIPPPAPSTTATPVQPDPDVVEANVIPNDKKSRPPNAKPAKASTRTTPRATAAKKKEKATKKQSIGRRLWKLASTKIG